jgi:hypothetical protein
VRLVHCPFSQNIISSLSSCVALIPVCQQTPQVLLHITIAVAATKLLQGAEALPLTTRDGVCCCGWLSLMKFFKQKDWKGQLVLKNRGISSHCGSQ